MSQPKAFPVESSRGTRNTWSPQGGQPNSPTTPMRKRKGEKRQGHGLTGKRSYVTKRKLVEIKEQLSQRDWRVLADVGRLSLVSGKQLRRLHYQATSSGQRLARMDLARLSDWRVLTRLDRRVGGVRAGSEGFVYALDALGQRLVFPKRRRYRLPYTPQSAFIAHSMAASELYVELKEAESRGELDLIEFNSEPSCWRRFSGPGGRALVLKPDAFVVSGRGQYEYHYFVEVDRNTESLPRITEKARLYARYWQSGREQGAHGVFPGVLWVVPDERRRTRLIDALGMLDAEHWPLFQIVTTNAASHALTGSSTPGSAS